jgi:hypothetical protein
MADPITGGIMAGGALLGGIAGGQKSGGGTTTQVSEPWAPQQPFLTYGFDQAKSLYGQAAQNPAYTGQRVAGLTPEQQALIGQGTGFGGSQFPLANQVQGMGMGMLTPGAQFGTNAANIYGSVAGMDPTQQIIANAGQYADNPYVQSIIDASSRDVTRNLLENQLPSLAMGATGTGNINSTRAGVQQAIAERSAAERLADISSGIRGQFFQSGLNMSQEQYNRDLQNQLAANEALRQSYGAGLQGLGAGADLAAGGFALGSGAAGQQQLQQQAELDAQRQQFAEQRDMPMDLLGRYMQLVQGNYGGTQTQTAPSTGGGFAGVLQGALGGALGGASLGRSFGGGMLPGQVASGANPLTVNNGMGYFFD